MIENVKHLIIWHVENLGCGVISSQENVLEEQEHDGEAQGEGEVVHGAGRVAFTGGAGVNTRTIFLQMSLQSLVQTHFKVNLLS